MKKNKTDKRRKFLYLILFCALYTLAILLLNFEVRSLGVALDLKFFDQSGTSSEVLSQGAQVYAQYCATCHGVKGFGDGVASNGLHPRPRNLVEGRWTQGGDSISLYKTIRDGIPGTSMPSFAYLALAERWAVVQFVRSISKDRTP